MTLRIQNPWLNLGAAVVLCMTAACVYKVDIQQGNKLEPQDIESLKIGMTRNQVRFLLGTPVVSDLFRNDRWDYVYYFRRGGSDTPERRWLIVWFEDDLVREIERNAVAQSG